MAEYKEYKGYSEEVDEAVVVVPDSNGHGGDDGHPLRGEPGQKIRLIAFNDIKLGSQRRYLVKGIIPRVGVAVAWGPPKCGKSFWAFDLSMHVALGWEYRGRRVQQGAVVYCAFEGQSGFDARVEAFRQNMLADRAAGDVPFYLEPITLKLVRDQHALIAAIRQQLGDVGPAMVTLDTLNRSINGSESSDEDMTAYINAADAIRAAFECAVLIIHHCGIDGTRPRGHTSLTGAVVAQIAVRRKVNNVFATVEHMKDGPEGAVLGFRMEHRVVGKDVDSEDVSSMILVPLQDGDVQPAKKPRKLSAKYELAVRILVDLIAEQGEPVPVSWDLPRGIMAVQLQDWRKSLIRRGVMEDDRKRFWDLKKGLMVHGLIAERDGLVWSARHPGAPQ
jgi:AAA domain